MPLLPTVRSWARRLVAGAVLLAALYLLAANLFLLPSVGPSLISRRPERFRLGWQSAWSVWPGEVRFRGLEIRGNQPRVRWWITAEQGTARIDLAALLRREVRIEHLRAAGVRSQTDRKRAVRSAAGGWSGDGAGSAASTLDGPARTRRAEPGPGARLRSAAPPGGRPDRRELPDRPAAGGGARGYACWPCRPARLLVRGSEAARDVAVDAELRLGPYAPRQHRGIAGFDFLTGHLTAEGKVAELPILRRIGPAEAAAAGPGTLAIDLRVEKGRLVPGSRLRFEAPGGARLGISGEVAGDRLRPRRGGRGAHSCAAATVRRSWRRTTRGSPPPHPSSA